MLSCLMWHQGHLAVHQWRELEQKGGLGTTAVQKQLGDHLCLISAGKGKARNRDSDQVQQRAKAEALVVTLASVCVCLCVSVCV